MIHLQRLFLEVRGGDIVDFKKQFEQPPAIINRDMKQIYIETPGNYSGKITLKNDGGSVLSGKIMSNSGAVKFQPEDFSGNNNEISFHIDTSMYAIGDELRTNAVIVSNGGEHSIDFSVKIVPFAIETKEGVKIASLDDFFSYSDKYPIAARTLFASHEFTMWLHSSGYEFMDLHDKLVDDANKEKALENFLLFNGYRQKANISVVENNICVKLLPFSKEVYAGNITLTKSGEGYVDLSISVKNNSQWLKLEKGRLMSQDFDESMTAYISFFIDPDKLDKDMAMDVICIGTHEIILTARKISYIEAELGSGYIGTKAESYILIKNNSGSRLTVDVLPKDSFLKFESGRYYIKETARIPFRVELSAIQIAQMSLLKQPEIKTHIIIDTVFNKKPYVKKLDLTIGAF